jgi:hypothetical protein
MSEQVAEPSPGGARGKFNWRALYERHPSAFGLAVVLKKLPTKASLAMRKGGATLMGLTLLLVIAIGAIGVFLKHG